MSVTKVCSDINELDKDTQLALSYLVEAMDAEGIPYRVFETYRSQARQDYLYAQGRSVKECVSAGMSQVEAQRYARSGSKVTWTRSSIHKERRAIDIIHPVNLWDMNNNYWLKIAELAKDVGFVSGYYWKNQDKPHIQLPVGVKPKRILKEKEYMRISQNVEINGIKGQIEAIQDEGRTYVKVADLESYGIDVKWNEGSKTILLENKTLAQKINVDGVMNIVDAVKICDRIFVKASDMVKLGYDVSYAKDMDMVMISKE